MLFNLPLRQEFDEVHGTATELQQTAQFIMSTGLSVYHRQGSQKKKKKD
jgi:hypothetical protein